MTMDTAEKFNTFIATQLNKEQYSAVTQKDGVLIVCAGAGSGKTRVITARITHLMTKYKVKPWEIIALTFTNKAAREMQERVRTFLPPHSDIPFVGTFHSYCLRLLKINSHLLEVPEFSILDSDDQEKLVKQILHRFGVHKKIASKAILHAISQNKNSIVTPHDLQYAPTGDLITQQIIQAYEKEKKIARCFDFDDLLIETIKLFHNNPTFKEKYQNTVRHILVDEYQDTNHTQHTLLKLLSLNNNECILDSLCVVGDEDQSIYSWRGATVTNIINFNKDFPTATSITIAQNYRSIQPILDLANNIIKNNSLRNKKTLWSERTAHNRIQLLYCNSGYQEADAVTTALKNEIKKQNVSCAVLYRSHYQSRIIEDALLRNAIPYKIIGGIQFYERQEIKDLLAYLRLLANNFDRVAFMRIINTPLRGFGDAFQEQFMLAWNNQPFASFKEIAQQQLTFLSGKKHDALKNFIELFSVNITQKPAIILEHFIVKTGYYSYLKDSFDTEEAQVKIENAKELVVAVRALEEQGILSVADFLHEVALLQDAIKKPTSDSNCVTLMTLHAAKGLEFDTVIITGLEEGILPSSHSLYQPDKLEEERRLLYVGITRARERLILTYTRYRTTFGQMNDQVASRFIKELSLSRELILDCTEWENRDFVTHFYRWFQTNSQEVSHTPLIITDDPFEETITPAKSSFSWHKNQRVRHKKFGAGIIQKIETKNDDTTYLTIQFGSGNKKIAAQFVTAE